MDREEAHELIDKLYDSYNKTPEAEVTINGTSVDTNDTTMGIQEPTRRELPKDKRVVRTKSSGDRVYYIDEIAKTRQWITNPDVLKNLGFGLEDVTEVDDTELLRYQMAAALYKVDNAATQV